MTTADYALIVSIMSAILSFGALLWNVWSKYLFVKPQVQVSFAIYSVMRRRSPRDDTMVKERQLLSLNVTNMGPGPVIIHACIVRKRRWTWQWRRRWEWGYLNPIHGDPTAETPIGIGPFGGGLPKKLDAGEVHSFYLPYNRECCLRDGVHSVGVTDTYGRKSFCRRRDMRKAMADYKETFPTAAASLPVRQK